MPMGKAPEQVGPPSTVEAKSARSAPAPVRRPSTRLVPSHSGEEVQYNKHQKEFYMTDDEKSWARPGMTVEIVDVEQRRFIEIGYRSGSGGQAAVTVPREALMLTQDETIVNIQLAVQYQVDDPRLYLFNVRDPDAVLKQTAESALREVIGKSKMDFVLQEGRAEVVARTKTLMQDILNSYASGLLVSDVNLQDAQPPEEVQGAFSDAIKAREDRVRLKNEAEAYANDVIPKARGTAARQVQEAEGYRESLIAKAEGEASRFTQLLGEYEKAPEVTRKRLYLETMESVMSRTGKVVMARGEQPT